MGANSKFSSKNLAYVLTIPNALTQAKNPKMKSHMSTGHRMTAQALRDKCETPRTEASAT
jgi:hypothetical protein